MVLCFCYEVPGTALRMCYGMSGTAALRQLYWPVVPGRVLGRSVLQLPLSLRQQPTRARALRPGG
eukprot:3770110-Rhodomonas_salina.1